MEHGARALRRLFTARVVATFVLFIRVPPVALCTSWRGGTRGTRRNAIGTRNERVLVSISSSLLVARTE